MAAVHAWAVPAVLPVTIVRDASVSLRPRLAPASPPSYLSGVPWLQGLTPLLATARIAPWGEILLAAFMSYPPGRWCAIDACDVRYCHWSPAPATLRAMGTLCLIPVCRPACA